MRKTSANFRMSNNLKRVCVSVVENARAQKYLFVLVVVYMRRRGRKVQVL